MVNTTSRGLSTHRFQRSARDLRDSDLLRLQVCHLWVQFTANLSDGDIVCADAVANHPPELQRTSSMERTSNRSITYLLLKLKLTNSTDKVITDHLPGVSPNGRVELDHMLLQRPLVVVVGRRINENHADGCKWTAIMCRPAVPNKADIGFDALRIE